MRRLPRPEELRRICKRIINQSFYILFWRIKNNRDNYLSQDSQSEIKYLHSTSADPMLELRNFWEYFWQWYDISKTFLCDHVMCGLKHRIEIWTLLKKRETDINIETNVEERVVGNSITWKPDAEFRKTKRRKRSGKVLLTLKYTVVWIGSRRIVT